jgi:transposase InsO family protein
MTTVWTAEHSRVYLHAIIDCCTRQIAGWSLDLRCRDDEAILSSSTPRCRPAEVAHTWQDPQTLQTTAT